MADEPDRDELLYRPGMIDPSTEDKYIKLARSFRMFAMMETRMLDTEKHSRVSQFGYHNRVVCARSLSTASRGVRSGCRIELLSVSFVVIAP